LKIVVIGAGVMGLSSALDLLEEGHDVTIIEAAPSPGGMAGSFDFGGAPAEKFYHFICGADDGYFRWLDRLGLRDRLSWRPTSMSVFHGGRLYPFGDPWSLLRFDPLSFPARVRYGLHVLQAKRLDDWRALENVSAREWLIAGTGAESYRVVWEPLLRQKFGPHTDTISAAWIWSRIHRLASSRDRMFQERLGFLDGGTDVLVAALVDAVSALGGRIECGAPVERLHLAAGRAVGVSVSGSEHPADAVVSTVPLPILARIAPDLPPDYVDKALSLDNIGVRCIILKLAQPLSKYFWVNVNDDNLPLCGLIEYTNLNPADDYSLVYSPTYVPRGNLEYSRPDEEVLEETLDAIAVIRPEFDRASVVDYRVFREPFAQPVCPVGFQKKLAPLRTPVPNLVAADTTHLLPHDRSISDSFDLSGKLMAAFRDACGAIRRAS
jgi:protoporphyrinogen oxidase